MVARSAEDYELYVKLILSSFKEYDGYVHVSSKEIEKFGLSHALYITHLRNLISRGEVEDFSVNGFFNRYKLHFKLDTPSFMIDKNLTFYEKVFLYKLRILVPIEMEKVSNKYLQSIFSPSDNKSHFVTRLIYKCRNKLDLDNLLPYVRNIEILNIDIREIYNYLHYFENGFQIVPSSHHVCRCCGTTDQTKFKYRKYICNDCYKKQIKQDRLDDIYKYLYKKSYRSFTHRHNILSHTITIDDIKAQYEKQNGLDYYTGLPLEDKLDISIDRIDSSKGYEPENIVLTRIIINQMKNNLSTDEFAKLITQIHSHISRQGS